MDEVPPLFTSETGLGLERSDHKVTIRGAKVALEKARGKGQADELAAALIRLAHLHFRQGRYAQTRKLVEEMLCITPAETHFRCDGLRILGNCAAELGDPDGAEDYYHQAVDLARQCDYPYGLYKCLHSLATNIYWPRGQFDLCLAAGKEALAQAEALHLSEELWFPLADIAWVYWSTAQYSLAGQVADRMESVVSPGSLGEGFTFCLRAGLEKPGDGYLNAVLPLYDRARSIAEATGDPGLHVEVRLGLCRAYRGVRDLPAAAAWAEDAVAVTLRLSYRQFQAVALIERARTALDRGDRQAAQVDLDAAVAVAFPLRANFDLARAALYMAVLEEKPGSLLLDALRRIQRGGYVFLLDEEREISYPLLFSGLAAENPEIRDRTAEFLKELQAIPARPLTIQTLGGLQVHVGLRKIDKKALGQRRADELLVLLLLAADYSLTYEQISEALWPEKDPDSTRSHFHQSCSKLRHALEPELIAQDLPSRYLFIENGRVSLHLPAGSRVDVHDFYSLCKQEAWDQALKTVHGEFLPEYPYAEWLFFERQRIAPLYQRALFLNAQSCVQASRYADGLEFVRCLLTLEPWHEEAVLLGMQACMALGDKTGARRLYKQLEKTLSEELNTQPHADITAYFQNLNQRKK